MTLILEQLLSELHSRLYNSEKLNESRDWFEGDMYDNGQLNNSIEDSGFISQKKGKKADKQTDNFVKKVESYQLESKALGRHLIGYSTLMNEERVRNIEKYLNQAQKLDSIFSEMKMQGNETMEDQIISTLARRKDHDIDLNRKLIDLQTEMFMVQSEIDQEKQVLTQGAKTIMEVARKQEQKRETEYKEVKKQDKVMTLYGKVK